MNFFESEYQKHLLEQIEDLKAKGYFLEPRLVQYSVSTQYTYVIKNNSVGEIASAEAPEKAWMLAIKILNEQGGPGPLGPGNVSRDT